MLLTKFSNCKQFDCNSCPFASSQPSYGEVSDNEETEEAAEDAEIESPVTAASIVEEEPENGDFTPVFGQPISPNCSPFSLLPCTEPVLVEDESPSEEESLDQSFSLTELDENASTCIAVGGPADGQLCKFPFIYNGLKYSGCVITPGGENRLGWCSTKIDINGIHISTYPERYIGYCDERCPTS